MTGAFVAATVVALTRFVETPDRKLVPLMGALLLLAFALSRDIWAPLTPLVPALLAFGGLWLALRPSLLGTVARVVRR